MNTEIAATDAPSIDLLPKHGRESAICELRCSMCDEGMRFDDLACPVCGIPNLRYAGKNFETWLLEYTKSAFKKVS